MVSRSKTKTELEKIVDEIVENFPYDTVYVSPTNNKELEWLTLDEFRGVLKFIKAFNDLYLDAQIGIEISIDPEKKLIGIKKPIIHTWDNEDEEW